MVLSSRGVRRALVGWDAGGRGASAAHATPPDGPQPSADVRALVERQAQGAQRNHDEVCGLRDSFANT